MSMQQELLSSINEKTISLQTRAPNMFRFRDDLHPVISREQLIRTNEIELFPDAPGRAFTEKELLPAVRSFFREYVRAHGWFYPHDGGTLEDAIAQVRAHTCIHGSGIISSLGSAGSKFLKAMFRSYWDVDGGPSKAFWDDRRLDGVLRYRLGLNTSKLYHYTLSDGMEIDCRETFDINIKNVRYGFIVQRSAVSWFKPTAAFEVYCRFLDAIEKPVVWDPSCGFGARLLGFAAAMGARHGTYVGTEPASQTFRDLCSLRDELKRTGFSHHIDLLQQGSEDALPMEDASCDLVFTSPPYFDRECYFDEPTQCWNKFPKHEAWLDDYIGPTLRNARRVCKPAGHVVINVDVKNRDAIVAQASTTGLALVDELKLSIGRDHFVKHAQGERAEPKKFEPILVFRPA